MSVFTATVDVAPAPVDDKRPPRAEDWRPKLNDLPSLDPIGFSLKQMLGSGSFTAMFTARQKQTGEEVVVKFEAVDTKQPKLRQAAKVYKSLARCDSSKASKADAAKLPHVHWHGIVENFSVMVMDLLGPSLEDLFGYSDRKFDDRLTAALGLKILGCVEYLHSRGFIHGDVRPEHVAFNLQDLNQVHLIDFGLAQKYRDTNTKEHIAFQKNCVFLGDVNYCSLNTHCGHQQSRRDDLESLAYMLLYFSTGPLPWLGMSAQHIQELKATCHVATACPKHLAIFLAYACNLSFDQRPSYSLLGNLLWKWERSAIVREKRRSNVNRTLQRHRLHMLHDSSIPAAPLQTGKGFNNFASLENNFGQIDGCIVALPEYNFVPDWTVHLHERGELAYYRGIAVTA